MASGEHQIYSWQIPNINGETPSVITACAGATTVIVGANGSGKSALGHWLEAEANGVDVRRLLAHRRIWLHSSGPDITLSTRQELASHMTSLGRAPESRWRDDLGNGQRTGVLLFDLLAKINDRNARVAELIDGGATTDEVHAKVDPSPLTRLNAVLARAELGVELDVATDATFDAIIRERGARFPISQMSDGEKSAVLLTAEVLTAPPGCVQIVDEPERHLHRSISAGLFEALIEERADCHFVVLTHDLDLAGHLAHDDAETVVVSGCSWAEGSVVGWDLHQVNADAVIPESVRAAILGGRDDLLFVEGDRYSLDAGLYAILFPGLDVRAVGSCEQVIRAVTGLHDSGSHHWVSARGIVDLDGRDETEHAALRDKGILVLGVHEIENLYYLSLVTDAVADQQAQRLERERETLIAETQAVSKKALSAGGVPKRLASAVAAQTLTRQTAARLPKASELAEGAATVAIELDSPYATLLAEYHTFVAEDNLDGLISRFPIRESPLRNEIARVLGFRTPRDYEAFVRSLLRNDATLRTRLQQEAGQLP